MPSYRDAQPPGFEITSELRTWETTHKCPRCLCEIYAGEKDGFRIEACGRCGGVFVEADVAKRALAVGSRAPEELAHKVQQVTQRVVQNDDRALECPECSAPMSKSTLGNAKLDTCAAHGTWFDPHELAKAMAALRGDGALATSVSDERALEAMRPRLSNEVQRVAHAISNAIDALDSVLKLWL